MARTGFEVTTMDYRGKDPVATLEIFTDAGDAQYSFSNRCVSAGFDPNEYSDEYDEVIEENGYLEACERWPVRVFIRSVALPEGGADVGGMAEISAATVDAWEQRIAEFRAKQDQIEWAATVKRDASERAKFPPAAHASPEPAYEEPAAISAPAPTTSPAGDAWAKLLAAP